MVDAAKSLPRASTPAPATKKKPTSSSTKKTPAKSRKR
jgi:hypothetical protein